MELTKKSIKWLKYNMIFFATIVVLLILIGAFIASNIDQELNPRLYLWGCVSGYSSIRLLPIAGFTIMLYLTAFGYQKGYVEQYFEHSTRGVLTGEEARKLGRNQIIVGVVAFGLCLYGAFMDVSVLSDCPEYFYDASGAQVFEKLF